MRSPCCRFLFGPCGIKEAYEKCFLTPLNVVCLTTPPPRAFSSLSLSLSLAVAGVSRLQESSESKICVPRDSEPKMTVLARASCNLTEPTPCCLCLCIPPKFVSFLCGPCRIKGK
jgi:hypothetical protein